MTERIEKVENIVFDGDTIQAVKENEKVWVPLKPICTAMGIDWKGQQKLLQRDEVLSSVAVTMTATGSDGKNYEMLCLPLDYLNGWLFKLTPSLFNSEEVRAKVIRYQRECFRVLAEHFLGKASAEAAVSAAVMEQARKCELNDRRLILKQLGGIMKIFWVDADCIARLAKQAEEILVAWPDRPASLIPYEAWAEEGSDPEVKLMERAAVVGRNQVIGKKPRTLGC